MIAEWTMRAHLFIYSITIFCRGWKCIPWISSHYHVYTLRIYKITQCLEDNDNDDNDDDDKDDDNVVNDDDDDDDVAVDDANDDGGDDNAMDSNTPPYC